MTPLNISNSAIDNCTKANFWTFGTSGIYRLLGVAYSVNLNSLNLDNPVVLTLVSEAAAGAAYYKVGAITMNNASTNLNTAQVGVYTAVAAGGNTLASPQALTTLAAATNDLSLTLATGATQTTNTANTIYVRNTTAQSAAATADVYVWGWVYP